PDHEDHLAAREVRATELQVHARRQEREPGERRAADEVGRPRRLRHALAGSARTRRGCGARSRNAASAGAKRIAARAFTRNMKASRTPMSAWKRSAEKSQVATPAV